MSVTAPREMPGGLSPRSDDLQMDAWVLCAEFVERILSSTPAPGGQQRHDFADVDMAAIWRAGDGAPSDEVAIGRIVRAASDVARQRALGGMRTEVANPEPPVPPPQVPLAQAAVVAGSTAQPTTEHTAQPMAETTTGPVGSAPGVVDSLTVAPPEPPVTTQLDVVHADEMPPVPAPAAPAAGSDQVAAETAVTRRTSATHSAWYQVFTWMRNVGVLVLLFVAWQLWGTSIAQHHAQQQLKSEFDAAMRSHHAPHLAKAPGSSLISAGTRFPPPANGSVVAELQIPAIGVDQYVVEGTNAGDLSKGPGHYTGTAMPGQAGNVAIAGHRTTNGAPFNALGHLVPGDRIILTTTWGEHLTYLVSETPQAVSPGDVGVLNFFSDNRITLTTCNPEFSSTQRLIVVGKLNHDVATGKPAKAGAYHVVDSGNASWNWSLLPAVGVEVSLLLLLGLAYRFFDGWFGRRTKWLILAPLWAAGVYLLFGTLTTFLPDSI